MYRYIVPPLITLQQIPSGHCINCPYKENRTKTLRNRVKSNELCGTNYNPSFVWVLLYQNSTWCTEELTFRWKEHQKRQKSNHHKNYYLAKNLDASWFGENRPSSCDFKDTGPDFSLWASRHHQDQSVVVDHRKYLWDRFWLWEPHIGFEAAPKKAIGFLFDIGIPRFSLLFAGA